VGEKISKNGDKGQQHASPSGEGKGRGRRVSKEKGGIGRERILKTALKLSKTMALQDLSIIIVARAMDVTPALIHYYIGGREWLTSGVMNLFYKNLLRKWPNRTGDWHEDVWNSTKTYFDYLLAYPGIAAYLVSNHRFRIFQLTDFGDRDHGVEMLDRLAGHVRAAGLSPERTGLHTQLIQEFVISTAHIAGHHLLPADNRQFHEEKLASLDPRLTENIVYGKVAPLQFKAASLFREGISLFLLGIQRDRLNEGVSDEVWQVPTRATRRK